MITGVFVISFIMRTFDAKVIKYTYLFKKMNEIKIAVDCIIIGYDHLDNIFKVLLSKRINSPNMGEWALPGGFVKQDEEFVEIAKKILVKETGLKNIFMSQLKAYSLTDTSANNRIISIAFYAITNLGGQRIDKGNQLSHWFDLQNRPKLPFDHGQKVLDAINIIKETAIVYPILYKLLPLKFTLNQVQRIFESLYGISIDNRNFRKKLNKLSYLEKLNELESNVHRRPGHIYKFNKSEYENSNKLF